MSLEVQVFCVIQYAQISYQRVNSCYAWQRWTTQNLLHLLLPEISPAEKFWPLEPWSWAWWRGWRRWWSGWWRLLRTSMVHWFHTATKEAQLHIYPRGLMWWAVICSMFISLGALLADKIGYSWCLQCLIRARAELQIVIDSWGKQGVNMKQQQEEESKLLRGHTTGVAAAFTAEIPRPWAEPTPGRSSTCRLRLLLLLERNLLLLSNVYNDLTSSCYSLHFSRAGIGAFVTNQWTWVHPIWSTPLLTLLMTGSSLYSSVLVILLPPNKACGRELTQCLRIMCGPKKCSAQFCRSSQRRLLVAELCERAHSPSPNLGQTWTIVRSMPTSYQPSALTSCLSLFFPVCRPNILNLCHFIVPGTRWSPNSTYLHLDFYLLSWRWWPLWSSGTLYQWSLKPEKGSQDRCLFKISVLYT